MAETGEDAPAGRTAGRWTLLAAGALFLVFVANIVIGKMAVLEGATEVPGLGDVGEFLVLFATVVLFIVTCLNRERAADARQSKATEHTENKGGDHAGQP